MMRHLASFIFFSYVLLICQCAIGQGTFEIIGTLPQSCNGAEVQLSGASRTAFKTLYTRAENGRFILSGKMNQLYEHVFLYIRKDSYQSKTWNFFIKNGRMKVVVHSLSDSLQGNDIAYFNFPLMEEQKEYSYLIKPLEDSASRTFMLFQNVLKGYYSGYDKDSLESAYQLLRATVLSKKVQYIKEHPDSYYSLYIFHRDLLNSTRFSSDSLHIIFSALNMDLQGTPLGSSVSNAIRKKQSLMLQKLVPDFSFKTNDGQRYSISSFYGKKYVLLCFWDSHCKPCIQNIPRLKKLAETYKELQLLSVSIDDDAVKWLAAVEKYAMPWLQTCDLPEYVNESKIRLIYDINFIPQYFLIDKNGKLIYQNVLSDDTEDYRVLNRLLENALK